jgi:hypothetical protein
MTDYETGFEDALHPCLPELEKSEAIKEAISRIEYLLGLVMKHRFDRIKRMLGAMK